MRRGARQFLLQPVDLLAHERLAPAQTLRLVRFDELIDPGRSARPNLRREFNLAERQLIGDPQVHRTIRVIDVRYPRRNRLLNREAQLDVQTNPKRGSWCILADLLEPRDVIRCIVQIDRGRSPAGI